MQGNMAAVKYNFNYCDWPKHCHINNCFLSSNLCSNDSVHRKRMFSLHCEWRKKTHQYDKQLAVAFIWWCYHVQNRSLVWGEIYKWGLKIFILNSALHYFPWGKWLAAGYSCGIPSTFLDSSFKLHPQQEDLRDCDKETNIFSAKIFH